MATTRTEQEEQRSSARWQSWRSLLEDALRTPGVLHDAYRRFPGYSVRNQLLALAQCEERGMLPGPLGTFVSWQRLGRMVKRGERAITLCVPITVKAKRSTESDVLAVEPDPVVRCFAYRRGWFTVHQTTGPDVDLPCTASWDAQLALQRLGVTITPFASLNGNLQGYASPDHSISISPVAALPHKTLVHELAHLVLQHHETKVAREVREVEAECVALLVLDALELPGSVYSRGYVQHWLRDGELTDGMAQRIFAATDALLAAGTPGG